MPGPRPLPLFLEMVRRAAERDPQLGARALRGLAVYQQAPRAARPGERTAAAWVNGAALRECGGAGHPIVLVPSLINPPHILDLDPETSLAMALGESGRVLLLDWGPAQARAELSIGEHVLQLLLPLLAHLSEPPILVGYCLGGTMAIAAAAMRPVRGLVTLASPWRFSAYPKPARDALGSLWGEARPTAERLGMLPIEILQAAFWSLDPERTVTKFAALADLAPDSAELRRFVTLEDWANGGEPLPLPAARELMEELFGADRSGLGGWVVGGRAVEPASVPLLHLTAGNDRIVPAATVAPGPRLACQAGHVGMIVGRHAPRKLHRPLREWLAALPAGG